MRTTQNVIRLVTHMHQNGGLHYAFQLQLDTGVPAGTASYILRQLEMSGHAIGRLEQQNAVDPAKPPRMLYELTSRGRSYAQRLPTPTPRAVPLGVTHAL